MINEIADRFVGTSSVMSGLTAQIGCAARSDAKVLITGESGVGKEVAARLIHRQSSRQHGPFVAINCVGVPDTLLEPELFGHTRGSFTGAYRDRQGRLEAGRHGTVFLDEIGEMSVRMQGLLLRFLETGEIQRVGAERACPAVDTRIIAATNLDLARAVRDQTFRADLYYRLNVVHIPLPPLRERPEDIPALLDYFFDVFSRQYSTEAPRLSSEARDQLENHHWPGNVRELRNVVERLTVRAPGRLIGPSDLPPEVRLPRETAAPPHRTSTSDGLVLRMVEGRESFWSVVYDPFMLRDLTRQDVRRVIERGLNQTRGSQSMLLELFNMPPDDHQRFLGFLRKHQCHLPLRRHRPAQGSIAHSAQL